MHATLPLLEETDFPSIHRAPLETLQVNLGYRCNQQCLHCHVNAGPRRKETMTRETAEQLASLFGQMPIRNLDLTGGAPELNESFRFLVRAAREHGLHVIDRSNLTIMLEPGQEDLADFLAAQKVEITASMPCYLQENVDRQRGAGVFKGSISVLKQLNALGYGQPESRLVLNLVYNPQGPTLPPPQPVLEADYRRQLGDEYGIVFTRLYTLTNMPIQRFGSTLISKGEFDAYMASLRAAHQPCNLDSVMCRTLLSVDWRGNLYDCDFNQVLDLPLRVRGGRRAHLSDLPRLELEGMPIAVKDHCYGCTAGHGSSCGGALNV